MDLLCWDDVDENATEIDDPIQELEQDVCHMLLERWGSNPDAPSRGAGLERKLSGSVDMALARQIEAHMTEDSRITAARALFTDLGGNEFRLDLTLQIDSGALGIAVAFDAAGNIRRIT